MNGGTAERGDRIDSSDWRMRSAALGATAACCWVCWACMRRAEAVSWLRNPSVADQTIWPLGRCSCELCPPKPLEAKADVEGPGGRARERLRTGPISSEDSSERARVVREVGKAWTEWARGSVRTLWPCAAQDGCQQAGRGGRARKQRGLGDGRELARVRWLDCCSHHGRPAWHSVPAMPHWRATPHEPQQSPRRTKKGSQASSRSSASGSPSVPGSHAGGGEGGLGGHWPTTAAGGECSKSSRSGWRRGRSMPEGRCSTLRRCSRRRRACSAAQPSTVAFGRPTAAAGRARPTQRRLPRHEQKAAAAWPTARPEVAAAAAAAAAAAWSPTSPARSTREERPRSARGGRQLATWHERRRRRRAPAGAAAVGGGNRSTLSSASRSPPPSTQAVGRACGCAGGC